MFERKVKATVAKRLFDIVISALAFMFLSPLYAVAALAIFSQRNGPILYRGERVGKDGLPFYILKFRTMVADAEKRGGSCTADDDPRVTRVGAFLRKYKLDEIPQFLNVLAGDMSLVGPRPEVRKYVDMYRGDEKLILKVRPGITDWASIWNSDEGSVLKGAKDPEQAYEELLRPTKIRLQLRYVRDNSVATDAKILIYTFFRLCNRNWLPAEIAEYGPPRPYALEPVEMARKA
jgi:lipopolysaccharide/colanic/teichoic acid biosynthesis glycosyltransferase